MSLSRYPAYKLSGVEWLDKMPTHWDAAALRWMSLRYSGGTPDKSNDAYWEEGEIPWLNSGAVNDGYITEPSALITQEGFSNSSAKWIPKGALVMALAGQGKTKGMVAQLGFQTTCNQSMAAIIPDYRIESRYLYWWLSSNYQNIRNMAGGEARDGLNLDMLGSIQCPLPTVTEQQTIADFLDAQTAKIDTLLAKKRQLIDKLKEKRGALIARTVTRGLPPAAAQAAGLEPHPAMKDSGVEWLGGVPVHWEVKRGRFLHEINPRNGQASLLSAEDEVSFVPMEAVGEFGGLNLEQNKSLEEIGSGYTEFENGDVVIAKITPCFENYKGALANNLMNGVAFGTTELHVLRVGQRLDRNFLFYLSVSHVYRKMGESEMYGAGGQKRVPTEFIKDFRISLPPQTEQQAIAAYLDHETARIDQLTTKVEAAIARLTEYRQALITAAVTGKIDVRNNARLKEIA